MSVSYTHLDVYKRQTPECRKGNEAVLEYLDQLQPDAVLTTSTRAELMDGAAEHTVAGLEPIVRDLTADGTTVVGFRDNPRLGYDPTRCVAEKGREDPSCTCLLYTSRCV